MTEEEMLNTIINYHFALLTVVPWAVRGGLSVGAIAAITPGIFTHYNTRPRLPRSIEFNYWTLNLPIINRFATWTYRLIWSRSSKTTVSSSLTIDLRSTLGAIQASSRSAIENVPAEIVEMLEADVEKLKRDSVNIQSYPIAPQNEQPPTMSTTPFVSDVPTAISATHPTDAMTIASSAKEAARLIAMNTEQLFKMAIASSAEIDARIRELEKTYNEGAIAAEREIEEEYQGQIDDLQRQCTALQGQHAALQSQHAALQSQHDALVIDRDNINEVKNRCVQRIHELTAALEARDATIQTLQDEVAALKTAPPIATGISTTPVATTTDAPVVTPTGVSTTPVATTTDTTTIPPTATTPIGAPVPLATTTTAVNVVPKVLPANLLEPANAEKLNAELRKLGRSRASIKGMSAGQKKQFLLDNGFTFA